MMIVHHLREQLHIFRAAPVARHLHGPGRLFFVVYRPKWLDEVREVVVAALLVKLEEYFT